MSQRELEDDIVRLADMIREQMSTGQKWEPVPGARSIFDIADEQDAKLAEEKKETEQNGAFAKMESLQQDIASLGDMLQLVDAKFTLEYKGTTAGGTLKASITHAAPPSVQFCPSSSNAQKKYTLIMTDPDAPSRATHEFREFIHWVVSDITAESLAQLGDCKGTTVLDYLGVGCPCNSGLHRYVFLLFEQPDSADPAQLAQVFAGRGGKKSCVAAQAAGLGPVVAVSFFESEWEESIDAVHIAMGWLPPEAYRSPSQVAAAAASNSKE